MNQATVQHPDADHLAAFVSGRLNDAESLEIETHLTDCQVCATVLERLPQDSIAALIQPSCTIAADRNATPCADVSAPTLGLEFEAIGAPCRTPLELCDHPRYRVLAPLGAGGMGTVFKAEHRRMERFVALKVINPKLIDSPAAVERFRREVKLAARLAHPNIVTAHDADQAGSLHFLVMEFVDGKSLAQVVAEQGPLPVAQACDYARQAALGLQHACDRHMVHRDIKPHNLMLTSGGQVKLLDFGLARFVLESAPPAIDTTVACEATAAAKIADPGVTGTGLVMGSVDYIAPEQVHDAHLADIRSDIYSLGCTLYFLLAGHPPFAGGSVAEKLAAHGMQTARPLTALRADLPAQLALVIERMMAKDAAQRFQTPAEVAEALAAFATGKPGVRMRRWMRTAVAASLVIIALGVVGYLNAPAIYRFATNQGELVIEVDDKHVEVVVKENGDFVRIIDTKTKNALTLKAGKYEMDLTPEQKKNGLRLETDRITLTRGGRQIVKAYFNPEGLKAAAAAELNRKIALQETKVQRQRTQVEYAKSQFTRIDVLGRRNAVVPAMVEEYRQKLAVEEATLAEKATELQQLRERARNLDKEFPLKEETELAYKIALLEKSVLRQRAQVHFLTLAFKRQAMMGDAPNAQVEENRHKVAIEEAILAEMVTELQQLRERARKLDNELPPGEVRQIHWFGRHLYSTGFSPDSRYYFATGSVQPERSTLRVWETKTGKLVREVTGVESAAFTPDGKRLLCAGPDKALHLWNMATGTEIRSFEGHTDWVTTVAISPDGKRAVSGSNDTTVRVWDLETGTELKRLEVHTRPARALFAPDGKHFLTYSMREDRTLRLWDAASYKAVRSWEAPGDHWNWFAAFAPDSQGFLTISYGDWTVYWWDIKREKPVKSLKLEGDRLFAAGFSSDCRRLIYAETKDNTIRLVDLHSGKETARFDVVANVPEGVMSISPDGRFAAGANFGGWVYLWRLPAPIAEAEALLKK